MTTAGGTLSRRLTVVSLTGRRQTARILNPDDPATQPAGKFNASSDFSCKRERSVLPICNQSLQTETNSAKGKARPTASRTVFDFSQSIGANCARCSAKSPRRGRRCAGRASVRVPPLRQFRRSFRGHNLADADRYKRRPDCSAEHACRKTEHGGKCKSSSL
jgi:hypothetical protein